MFLFSFISRFLHQHAHAFPSGGEFWACFNWSFLSIADYPSHTHCYDTQTTVSGRHRHRLFGRTSLPQGFEYQHTHYYEGTTSFDDGHIHYYHGVASEAI
ncbi:YmaF family protein [Brevibacillus choshinensis]|uniref:YmaF family protein n=1 Tax=Brevibacillus choshinensis TaxID=54911 RepID=UPI002E1BEEB9|nr:YmaF family protein [Brevibacillus choshinensis]